jgi:hypothetical protein
VWRGRLTPEELAALDAAEEHERRREPLPHAMREVWRQNSNPT